MKADFYTEVYNIVREIPEGCVVTYGQLAKLARRPQCSRMVGQAMFNVPKELNNGDYWRKKALPSRRMAALT